MATELLNPPTERQPEINLLLPMSTFEQPLWKSLLQNIDDFLFPKKLPPLKLTSRPEPVRDIWGFYNYSKNGALGSTVLHFVVLGLIIGLTILGRRVVKEIQKPHEIVTLIAPADDIPTLQPSKTQSGGGGPRFISLQIICLTWAILCPTFPLDRPPTAQASAAVSDLVLAAA